jgi:hypothetical protein
MSVTVYVLVQLKMTDRAAQGLVLLAKGFAP